MNRNGVATTLKVYSIINGFAIFILALILRKYLALFGDIKSMWVIVFASGLVVSFLIYAAGEVIQLLQDIKDNTASDKAVKAPASTVPSDDLPEI